MDKYNKYHESLIIDCCKPQPKAKSNNCCPGMHLPSHDNKIELLIQQLKKEVKDLIKSTDARLLCQNKKIDETMVYIKNNLSNSIRNLLNSMLVSGQLDEIITETVISEIELLQAKDDKLEKSLDVETKTRQAADDDLQSQITGLASGSPLVASSVAGMTNTNRIYVNTSDGYWYYYNGSSWTQGGVYQATGIADKSISLDKTKFASEKEVPTADLEVGTTSTQGNNIASDISLRTKGYILVTKGTAIKLNNTSEWQIYVNYYTVNGYDYCGTSGWKAESVTVPYDCYMRFVVRRNDQSVLSPEMAAGLVSIYSYNPDVYPIVFSPLRETAVAFTTQGNDVTVRFSSGRFYIILSDGAKIPINFASNTDFTIHNYESLIYNGLTGEFEVISHDDAINYADIALLAHNERGVITGGLLSEYYLNTLIKQQNPNYLYGKKIVAIGDSMVEGDSVPRNKTWLSLIAERNNMDSVNYGVNGCTLAYVDSGSYTKEQSVYARYESMDNDADYVIVFAGTNDIQREITLGDEDSDNPATFYGALNGLCEGLLTKYPAKKIAFITPYARSGIEAECETYVEAIKTACKNHGGIPVFDNITFGGIDFNNEAQQILRLNDSYHLNENGMDFVSYKYEQFIRSI